MGISNLVNNDDLKDLMNNYDDDNMDYLSPDVKLHGAKFGINNINDFEM